MPYMLTAAQKAPLSSIYPALIAAGFANHDAETPHIGTLFIDAPLLDQGNKDSTISLQLEEGQGTVYGSAAVLKALVDKFSHLKRDDEWVKFSIEKLSSTDFKAISSAFEDLETHLVLRTFISGYNVTMADIAVYGAIRGNAPAYTNAKKPTYINLHRWFKYMDGHPVVSKAVDTLRADMHGKKSKANAGSNFEIGLTNTDNGVVTRFPPEPSGYLHIGHAKAAMLNQYFAQQYNGKLIIRFDDTNPSKEKVEFQDSILEDLSLMGIHGDKVTYTSDYFDKLYDYCVDIIKAGKAYCDDTEQMKMRQERMDGIASARRERSVEENIQIFTEEMAKGTELGLKNCVRAKISVDAPNKALRDPVIYRCNPEPHHRTGDKWKIYPTYDFACPIVDSVEGVTHALRTMEYRDRNDQYWWMLKALGLRKVFIWDFARLNFIRTVMSKRKLAWFVNEGLVGGWDDPRFPTVRGIRRRGMTIEALRQFILLQGPSKNVVNLDWTIFWAMNKKVIDPVAPRFTAMTSEDIVPTAIHGGPAHPLIEDHPLHKKNPDLGNKKVYFSAEILIDQVDAQSFKENEEITLMSWGNAFVTNIIRDNEGKKVTGLEMKLHLEGDFKKTEKKITWVSTAQELIKVELVDFDYLITKDKIEEDDKFEDFVNKDTEFRVPGVAEVNVKELKEGDIIQFERKGYYRLDKPYTKDSPAVFFSIPTGKDEKKTKK